MSRVTADMNTKDPEGDDRDKQGNISLIIQIFGEEEGIKGKIEPE